MVDAAIGGKNGVNLDSLTKRLPIKKLLRKEFKGIGEAVELMAEAEGLQAHKNAMTLRRKAVENN